MPFWGSSKKLQVCQSSATVIKVIGFVKVGSGSEVVEAIVLRRAKDEAISLSQRTKFEVESTWSMYK